MNNKIKPVVVLGAGGHAKVLIEILIRMEIEVLGVSIKFTDKPEKTNYRLFSDDEVMSKFSPKEINLVNGVGSLPNHKVRYDLSMTYAEKGYNFISISHPSSIISSDVKISEGAQLLAGTFIGSGSSIGTGTIINSHSSIDHDCEIQEYCHIAPGVTCSGQVKIGKFVHVSPGVTVINNIKIGDNSIINPGVIVTDNVPSDSIVKTSQHNRIEIRKK